MKGHSALCSVLCSSDVHTINSVFSLSLLSVHIFVAVLFGSRNLLQQCTSQQKQLSSLYPTQCGRTLLNDGSRTFVLNSCHDISSSGLTRRSNP